MSDSRPRVPDTPYPEDLADPVLIAAVFVALLSVIYAGVASS